MARIARRRVLTLSASGGMAAILASGRAPALAQETSVHWLRWADFVPASDVLLKGQITQECKKATGITLKVETVNANDLQSRITSAIQSGAGADIIMAIGNWPQLYAESLADVGDVAEEIGKAQGGYYDVSRQVAHGRQQVDRRAVDGRRRADRLSQVLARGGRATTKLPRDLGHVPRCRQEAEGQGAADRPDRRATRSATRRAGGIPTCGRGAARRSRPTARPSC